MALHDFDPPDRFIAGAVGSPGERTFFLQASEGRRLISVSLEKEQVRLLGESLEQMLDQVAGEEGGNASVAAHDDKAPLDTPIDDDFRVRRLSVAWDDTRRVVIVEAHDREPEEESEESEEAGDDDADDADDAVPGLAGLVPPESLRVVLSPARARAFALRCASALDGGRPNCPFCGNPLDPHGHVCARANGYKR